MSLFNGKFILADSIDDRKIVLRNNEWLRAKNAAGDGEVFLLRANALDQVEFQTAPFITTPSNEASSVQTRAQIEALIAAAGSLTPQKMTHIMASTPVADVVVTLVETPVTNSIHAFIASGPALVEGVDYSVAGDDVTLLFASPVIALLEAGERVIFEYMS